MARAAYDLVPERESVSLDAADDDARDMSSPASLCTSGSPAPFLSNAGRTFTPLSMSLDSSDLQYPPDLDGPSQKPARPNDLEHGVHEAQEEGQYASTGAADTKTGTRGDEKGDENKVSGRRRPTADSSSGRNARAPAPLQEPDPATATAVPPASSSANATRAVPLSFSSLSSPYPLSSPALPTAAAGLQREEMTGPRRHANVSAARSAGAAAGDAAERSETAYRGDRGPAAKLDDPEARNGEELRSEEEEQKLEPQASSLRLSRRQLAEGPGAGTGPGSGVGRAQALAQALALGEQRGGLRRQPLESTGQRQDPPVQGQGLSPVEPPVSDTTGAEDGLHSREEDGAEITRLASTTKGHEHAHASAAGSTPLSIPTLLQSQPSSSSSSSFLPQHRSSLTSSPPPSAFASASHRKWARAIDPANNLTHPDVTARPPPNTLATTINNTNTTIIDPTGDNERNTSGTAHVDVPSSSSNVPFPAPPPLTDLPSSSSDLACNYSSQPSSPTSLIEQLQETLQRASSTAASASASVPSPVAATPQHSEPLVRTTSDSTRFTVRHPVPDLNTRSGAYAGNIAALEKTAERLSMTSSIDDAIRDLQGELKRSDSRRSSILAAATAAAADNATTSPDASPLPNKNTNDSSSRSPPLARQLSTSSSSNIVRVNNAARYGGYSPAGYVMSPSNSLTGRLRSASKSSAGRPEPDLDVSVVSRHGPGKASTRSTRSNKPTLAEIAESEPTALDRDALDGADQIVYREDEDLDDTVRPFVEHHQSYSNEPKMPTTDAFHNMLDEGALSQPFLDQMPQWNQDDVRQHGSQEDRHQVQQAELDRPATPRSTNTFDTAAQAFGDFDGVHCEPDFAFDIDLDLSNLPEPEMPEPRMEMSPPRADMPRPQSYYDEDTGQHMLYYPARVPAMLNLPPKLSSRTKAIFRNARHSKVLKAMGHPGLGQPEYIPPDPAAPPPRQSSMWLPDPVESEGFAPFPSESAGSEAGEASVTRRGFGHMRSDSQQTYQGPQGPQEAYAALESRDDTMPQPPPLAYSPKKERPEVRQSADPQQLDPHLRATAYFELPSTSPQIEIKGGSAMDTLDSILDASANAPVDAFTDHMYAGKLGREVYGRERRRARDRKSTATLGQKSADADAAAHKKRNTFFHFGRNGHEDLDVERHTMTGASSVRSAKAREHGDEEESQALSGSIDGQSVRRNRGDGENEGDGASDGEEDEEDVFDGPPTTLLAELQIRKHQQKLRTRNIHQGVVSGMHSTLLQLDAVREAESKNRKSRRVNLAWEDPAANEGDDPDNDEDVPLGLLYAARASGNKDIAAAAAELNRPLGLMERREMEDNEPLSARRARLQGRETMPATALANRRSFMTLNPGASTTRLPMMPSPQRSPRRFVDEAQTTPPPQQADEQNDEPDIEEETLGDRMRRLRAKEEAEHHNLPRARPVSSVFSAELLSQFGDKEESKAENRDESAGNSRPGSKGAASVMTHSRTPSALALRSNGAEQGGDAAAAANEKTEAEAEEEEEETLGQRRKRLQAEREARDREMSMNALSGVAASRPQLTKRLSLADTLSAYPRNVSGGHDQQHQQQQQQNKHAAGEMRRRDQEEKMAAMRAQMPQTLDLPSSGQRAGGFRGGTYNDGLGGGSSPGGMGHPYGQHAGVNASRHSVAAVGGFGVQSYGQAYGQSYGRPYGMGAQMGGHVSGGHGPVYSPGYAQGYVQGYGMAPQSQMAMQMPMGVSQQGMVMNGMGMQQQQQGMAMGMEWAACR